MELYQSYKTESENKIKILQSENKILKNKNQKLDQPNMDG